MYRPIGCFHEHQSYIAVLNAEHDKHPQSDCRNKQMYDHHYLKYIISPTKAS